MSLSLGTHRHSWAAFFAIFILACVQTASMMGCSLRAAPSLIPADWKTWEKTTDLILNYPIPGHENRLRIPRMNDIGFASLPYQPPKGSAWNFPAGTIIAKEVFATATPKAGEASIMLTAMIKAPQDPRARGGWIWVGKDLSTGKETVFTQKFCVTCHENANESHPYADKNPRGEFRDYVFMVPKSSLPNTAEPSGRPPVDEAAEYGAKQ